MTMSDVGQVLRRATRCAVGIAVCLAVYVLSSGPVLATAFWLRGATGRDEFYAALYLYAPLIAPKPGPILDAYIEWWVKLFGTVGPG